MLVPLLARNSTFLERSLSLFLSFSHLCAFRPSSPSAVVASIITSACILENDPSVALEAALRCNHGESRISRLSVSRIQFSRQGEMHPRRERERERFLSLSKVTDANYHLAHVTGGYRLNSSSNSDVKFANSISRDYRIDVRTESKDKKLYFLRDQHLAIRRGDSSISCIYIIFD